MIIAIFAAIPLGVMPVLALAIVTLFFLVPLFIIAWTIGDSVFSSAAEQACLHVGVSLGRTVTAMFGGFHAGLRDVAKIIALSVAGTLLSETYNSIAKCL